MKEKILELAIIQLKDGGYENLNFATIASALNTTRANLHYHFKNKESLALEATEKYMQERLQEMRALGKRHNKNFPSFIRAFENSFLEHLRSEGKAGTCVCSQLVRGRNVPDSLINMAKAYFNKVIDWLTLFIEESQQAGSLKSSPSALKLSLTTTLLMVGLNQMGMTKGDEANCALLLEGILDQWVENYRS